MHRNSSGAVTRMLGEMRDASMIGIAGCGADLAGGDFRTP
jgi:hypothetical protein